MTAVARPLILAEPEAPFWGFGEVFLVVALFLTALGVTVNIATHFLHEDAKLGYWAVAEEFIAYIVVFAGLKALFAFHGRPLLASLGWVASPFRMRTLLAIGAGLFLFTVMLQIVLLTPNTQTPFDRLLTGSPWSRVAIALFGVTLGPVVEELLFRGLLQPVLMNATGVLPGILITAALFGALHLGQNAYLWQSGFLITLAGFAFGVVRHVSGSTKASTLTHVAYNALPCLVTLLQGTSPIQK